jgi:hypothetical protein
MRAAVSTICREVVTETQRSACRSRARSAARPVMPADTPIVRAPVRAARHAALIALVWACGCSAAEEAGQSGCPSRSTRVGLGTTLNICPAIVSLGAAPSEAFVGGEIHLDVSANDPDSPKLTFLWEPSVGAVADPKAATTTYRCMEAGSVSLRVTVSDGQCGDSEEVTIICRACASDAGPCSDGG